MSGSERPSFSGALAVGRKLDLPLPDSPAVRDAYAQAEAESQPWLFNHVMRSWLYSATLAQRRALAPDAELVAVAVLLHASTSRQWQSGGNRARKPASLGAASACSKSASQFSTTAEVGSFFVSMRILQRRL